MTDATDAGPPTLIMEMSDKIDAISKALPKAQASMGEVFKNANNPAFRAKYADLAAVVEAVLPALNANGITLLQPAAFDGVHVNVATMLLHESGQWVRCTLAIPLGKRDAHGVGSAVTYGRRFGLQAMSGVAPVDDDGNAAATKDSPPPPEPKRAEPKPPTLADRADRLVTTLKGVKTAAELKKAYDLGAGLMAELDAKDPERFAEIQQLHDARDIELSERKEAA
jgi:hypothetical protein